jgi:predicted nucleotidyltransferase
MEENEAVTLEELRGSKREQILRLADSYGARNLRVFGSVARGDSSAASDIVTSILPRKPEASGF